MNQSAMSLATRTANPCSSVRFRGGPPLKPYFPTKRYYFSKMNRLIKIIIIDITKENLNALLIIPYSFFSLYFFFAMYNAAVKIDKNQNILTANSASISIINLS